MRSVLSAVTLGVLAASLAVAQGLTQWAQEHWAALASGDAARVAAQFAPTGAAAFLGSPWHGFYYGQEAIEALWTQVFSAWAVREAYVRDEPKVIDEAGLVYAFLELVLSDGGVITLVNYIKYGDAGEILAADYVVVGGAEPLGPVLDGVRNAGEYTHEVLDPATNMTFAWQNGTVVLYGFLHSPGMGYASVGFNTSPGKPGANLLMFAVLPTGELVYEDHVGVTKVIHRRDSREDILMAAGIRDEKNVYVEFVIPLDSNDPEDVPLIPGGTYWVLFARQDFGTSFTAKHSSYGLAQITLDR